MKKGWIILIIVFILIMACLVIFLARTPDFLRNMSTTDAAVKTGSYVRIQPNFVTSAPVAVEVVQLDIDRENSLAVFHLEDGSTVSAALAGTDLVQWAEGCPTMAGSTRMEFVPLVEDQLVLDDTTFESPYLVGKCPVPPVIIVLGEKKRDFTGIQDAAACEWYNGAKCVYFEQK